MEQARLQAEAQAARVQAEALRQPPEEANNSWRGGFNNAIETVWEQGANGVIRARRANGN